MADKDEIIRQHMSELGKKGNHKKKGFAANPERARQAAIKSNEVQRRKRAERDGLA